MINTSNLSVEPDQAHTHVHPSSGAAWIVLVFAASWWVWFTTTLCADRYHMIDLTHRFLLLSQMLVIVLMAMEARASVAGDSTYLALEYGFLLLTIALMFFRAARRDGIANRSYARHLAAVNMGTASYFFVAALLPESARMTLSAAALVLLVVPSILILHRIEDFSSRDEHHMVERLGAFTLIVCGESFVEIAIALSHATIDRVDIASLVFEFILVFALFATHFEVIPAAGLNQRRFGWWAGSHLVAQVCIAGTAVSASKLIDLITSHRLPDTEILRMTVPLAIFYLAMTAIGWSTRRRPVLPLATARLTTAVVVVVVGILAWWIPWIHMAEALPLFTAVAVIHAVVAVRLRSTTRVIRAISTVKLLG
jgi:low temperature requirement protein LtrA